MQLTSEQLQIINSEGNIKINAVAGSGKTTTMIAYAKSRPKGSKILYLAFNKSVKLYAVDKFAAAGLTNVQVETAHSLAFKYVVYGSGYRIKQNSYAPKEIVDLLHLTLPGDRLSVFVIANHILNLVAMFNNSSVSKVQDLNFLQTIVDETAKTFVRKHFQYIEKQARILLSWMDKGLIEITHDFYLKKFQLFAPELGYDFILFDEGQDASAAMLQVFVNQKATKVIVGDTHQQIYSWRYAVNSLEQVHFKTFELSNSFRFGNNLAQLANSVLKLKNKFQLIQTFNVVGKGTSVAVKQQAIIARTNLGLLLKAITYLTEKKSIQKIYFEGNFNAYTYADEGASLYDILNLRNGRKTMIKDPLIKEMNNLDDLDEYIEKTNDVQLGMMLEIVNKYGNKLPSIIKMIKDKHVLDSEKHTAEMIFSTVHRCKGMEYDIVHLADDFTSEISIDKNLKDSSCVLDKTKLNEEINLLYVAITRAKNKLYIPKHLMPKGFPELTHIHIVESEKSEAKAQAANKQTNISANIPVNGVKTTKYAPWTKELDKELSKMFFKEVPINQIATYFGRTKGAIVARIKKLELVF